ncbi:hypothetical protein [Acidipila sp. EB88]|uniref:hypothetical protein n=1 Tax=Acidipila sp. EB88 TaxID=2305226 RepID=UPI0018F51201|nr:hypothetical protein [Acidipila sp. EB88]
MFGLIWFIQVVHYPLFLQVTPSQFPVYEAAHANRTTYVVAPLMLLELASALLLLVPRMRPPQVSAPEAWIGVALVAVLWGSTAFIQVPLHNRLHLAYSAPLIQRLVRTNWIRTVAWSARALLVLHWAYRGALTT